MIEHDTPSDVQTTPPPTFPPLPGTPPVEPALSSPDETAAEPAGIPTERRRAGQTPRANDERRKSAVDRRYGLERRVVDIGAPTGLERRRGPGRRRSDDRRSAEEGEMTDEQFEFVLAVDTYKRLNNRPFPTWTEILEVVKQLGYRKVAVSTLSLPASTSRGHSAPPPVTPPAPPVKPSDYIPG